MKKIVYACLLLIFATAVKAEELKKEVIVFSQPCYYCDQFKDYMRKTAMIKYKDVEFTVLDIREKKNLDKLMEFAKKYDLPQNSIGLPLIFVGDSYIMGWSPEQEKIFTGYVDALKTVK